ncbi:MAG: heme exporter protein CcmD [Gammaproteobacteria bacterium]|nr:heme exporter protein CcmD [Gammaproteobacteria bacterium]
MSEFLHMGGYASFVWSSYALSFILMFGMMFLSFSQHKKKQKIIQGRIIRAAQQKAEKKREEENE